MTPLSPTASIKRSSAQTLTRQRATVQARMGNSIDILNSIPNIFAVLNEHRQIVYANEALLQLLGIDSPECLSGKRPGEALQCLRAASSQHGCGSTDGCRTCGILQAIAQSEEGQHKVQECRIIQDDGSALDLRVWASPLLVHDEAYTILAVLDISHEKRRQLLERIFFHDVLNTAGGLLGFTKMLSHARDEELDYFKQALQRLAERLIDEITAQGQLSAAERGDLKLQPQEISTRALLEELREMYAMHEVSHDKRLEVDDASCDSQLYTDPSLVRRVVGNMIKNALEAIAPGQSIRLGCRSLEGAVEFWVRNPGSMPEPVQQQVFHRSFSTKDASRGVGAYSMKLLGERYLCGQVGFTSSEHDDTCFTLRIPHRLPGA